MLTHATGTPIRRSVAPAVAQVPNSTVRTAPLAPRAPVDSFAAAPVKQVLLAPKPVALPVTQKDIWSSDDAALNAVSGDRPFHSLSETQRGLFVDGEKAYLALSDKQRQLVLLLTERLMANGIDLQGMHLKEAGAPTRPNRILFDPASPGMDRFVSQLQAGTKEGGNFDTDKVFPLFHPGMSELGFREDRRKFSMQIGVGSKGAFVDVDRYNPFTDWKAWLGHFAEIVIPGKPSADTIATAIAG